MRLRLSLAVLLLVFASVAARAQDAPAATTPPQTAALAQEAPAQEAPAQDAPPPARPRMTPPKPIQIANPEFSELARKKKLGGDVMVVLTVDADGMPQNVRVARSLADKVPPKDRKAALSLDEKAIEAVQKYRFKPATRDGNPVATEIHIDVNFQIF